MKIRNFVYLLVLLALQASAQKHAEWIDVWSSQGIGKHQSIHETTVVNPGINRFHVLKLDGFSIKQTVLDTTPEGVAAGKDILRTEVREDLSCAPHYLALFVNGDSMAEEGGCATSDLLAWVTLQKNNALSVLDIATNGSVPIGGILTRTRIVDTGKTTDATFTGYRPQFYLRTTDVTVDAPGILGHQVKVPLWFGRDQYGKATNEAHQIILADFSNHARGVTIAIGTVDGVTLYDADFALPVAITVEVDDQSCADPAGGESGYYVVKVTHRLSSDSECVSTFSDRPDILVLSATPNNSGANIPTNEISLNYQKIVYEYKIIDKDTGTTTKGTVKWFAPLKGYG